MKVLLLTSKPIALQPARMSDARLRTLNRSGRVVFECRAILKCFQNVRLVSLVGICEACDRPRDADRPRSTACRQQQRALSAFHKPFGTGRETLCSAYPALFVKRESEAIIAGFREAGACVEARAPTSAAEFETFGGASGLEGDPWPCRGQTSAVIGTGRSISRGGKRESEAYGDVAPQAAAAGSHSSRHE